MTLKKFALGLTTASALTLASVSSAQGLLNSSYDIARELFASYNQLFSEHWPEQDLEIQQSHGGSSAQAQAILQGLRADVVTFNQVTDINILASRGNLLPEDWQTRLPNNSSPYFSTMAFLVRKDNPKNIQNWDDLVREEVSLVFPNPKTSGNGRYTYLAARGFAQQQFSDEQEQQQFLSTFLSRVEVFDNGGRGATNTFIDRGIGDVLITFESEVRNILDELNSDDYQIVVPQVSFLAEFPVAWLDRNVQRNNSAELAKAYLEHLYSQPAQELLAGFNYRVHHPEVVAANAERFPELQLLTIEDIAGSWDYATNNIFNNGGELDRLLSRR